MRLAVLAFVSFGLFAQSKEALKAQLTASEIALEASKQRNADTAGKVAGMAVVQKYQKAAISETAKSVEQVHADVLVTASTTNHDLQFLQATADNNGYLARLAEANAKIERAHADVLIAKAGNVTTTITLIIAPIAVGAFSWWVKRSLNDVHSAIVETKTDAHAALVVATKLAISSGLELVDGRLVDPNKVPRLSRKDFFSAAKSETKP